MKANNDKKVDLAKEILLAYIANSPNEARDVETMCAAAKKIFETVESLLETTQAPSTPAGFRP